MNDNKTKITSASVSPMATSRTFHQGRVSGMSYALLSAETIDVMAPELLQSAPSIPMVKRLVCFTGHNAFELLANDRQHFGRGDGIERRDDVVDDVIGQVAGQGHDEEQRGEERQGKVIRQLRCDAHAVIVYRFP